MVAADGLCLSPFPQLPPLPALLLSAVRMPVLATYLASPYSGLELPVSSSGTSYSGSTMPLDALTCGASGDARGPAPRMRRGWRCGWRRWRWRPRGRATCACGDCPSRRMHTAACNLASNGQRAFMVCVRYRLCICTCVKTVSSCRTGCWPVCRTN
eukprot:XP_001692228.1 LOW QUALITY PROTEIN: predicted protein [Chlamydomonas reinhardtii]